METLSGGTGEFRITDADVIRARRRTHTRRESAHARWSLPAVRAVDPVPGALRPGGEAVGLGR